MSTLHRPLLAVLVALATPLLPAPASAAQSHAAGDLLEAGAFSVDVPGEVTDLAPDGDWALLYCTRAGEVGRITTIGDREVLATPAAGFAGQLRAVVRTPAGKVAVLDEFGHVYHVQGGGAVRVYSDLYMIQDASDMIVDARGNFLIASATPSNGRRGINWVSADGVRWAYWVVDKNALQLAADPLTGDILCSDVSFGGVLWKTSRLVDTHPSTVIDGATLPGFNSAKDDGDIAVFASGDFLFVANGTLYLHRRGIGTSVVVNGFDTLRGVAIARSTRVLPGLAPYSAYLAEGANPTHIRQWLNFGPPASAVARSLGTVPDRGLTARFFGPIRVYDLAADANGHLLVGGDFFGSNPSVRRIELPSLTMTTIADQTNGISGRIEGLVARPDGTIYALTHQGNIHRIRENPLQVTTVFTNTGVITVGKDLAMDRGGAFYVADREAWGFGEVRRILPNMTSSSIVATQESRGVIADPFTGNDLYVAEWINTGFESRVSRVDVGTGALTPVPGYVGMNYTNADSWGDGDLVMDVTGNVFTFSEDDWSLIRWSPRNPGLARIGSSYLNHPSGLVIARSTPGANSTTGWSLWAAEFDYLWELPNAAAPAPHLLDTGPGVGNLVGFFDPSAATEPRAMIPDPNGGGLYVSSANGRLERLSISQGSSVGVPLSGDLIAIAARSNGRLVAATSTGTVVQLDPAAGFSVTTLYAGGGLEDVRGICVDGSDRVIVVDKPASSNAGRLHRLDAGRLTLLTRTARGGRPAIDPLTAEVWVVEQGNAIDPGGEVLRVDVGASPPAHGHFRGNEFYTFGVGDDGGDVAFDANGNFYVPAAFEGRVYRVDRATGARTAVAGSYTRPVAVALAPGRPGIAGAQGTSLFVLDGHVVWEVGVSGLPAPAPPASDPGLAADADLRVHGELVLGGGTPVSAKADARYAGHMYVIYVSTLGKVPGFALRQGGNPTDTRVIPNNPDPLLWGLLGNPSILPLFIGTLGAGGATPAGAQVLVPNDPSILGLAQFLDLAWVVVDGSAPNNVGFVGGTAQLYVGN